MKQEACKTSHLSADAWFPTGNQTKDDDTKLAIAICERCPLRRECAQTVLNSLGTDYPIKTGIWAGIRIAESHSRHTKGNGLKEKYEQLEEIAGQKVTA